MTTWLIDTLVASAMLMLAVLAVRRPAARAFGARAAYALWLLPAARMVLPPLPGHRALYVPAMTLDPAGPVRVGLMPPASVADRLVLPPALDLPPPPQASWTAILLVLWVAGAFLWFGWQLLRYRRFINRALRGATLLGEECGIEVLLTDGVAGPVAAGILRRRILLPRDFVRRYDAAERRQALLHEGAHHDRGDLVANLAAMTVVALHWWNPLAHLAHRAFRADQELACDATVLARADAEARYAYGRALVKSSAGAMPAAACALDNATAIKRRLRSIGRGGVARSRRALGTLLAAIAIGGGLLATASSGAPTPAPTRADAFLDPPPALSPPPPPLPERIVARPPVDRQEALDVGREMLRAGEEARNQAERARTAALAGTDGAAVARAAIAETRARMAAACAARGRPVAAGEEDWAELALCGKAAFRADLRRSLAQAGIADREWNDAGPR